MNVWKDPGQFNIYPNKTLLLTGLKNKYKFVLSVLVAYSAIHSWPF